jgi:hypothetical protein
MNESPSQSLSTYKTTTSGVLDYLKNQLSSITGWNNIPGSLVKVSSSPGGYTWGYNSTGDIYSCKNPCSPPNWKSMNADRRKDDDGILDITTDSQFVYFLTIWGNGRAILKVPVDAQDFRKLNINDNVIFLPSDGVMKDLAKADSITVTDGYIQVGESSSHIIGMLSKADNTQNWSYKKTSTLKPGTKTNEMSDMFNLIGGGNKHTYFKSVTSPNILKSDETVQSGFTAVKGLEGINVSSIAADADNTVLYASDNSKLYKCDGICDSKDQLKVVDTQGHIPIQGKGSLSMDPSSRSLWMLTSDSTNIGNIFQRLDAPDISTPVLDYTNKTEDQRDRIFNSLGGSVAIQTAQVSSNMAKQEASDALKQMTDLTGDRHKVDNEITLLQRKIEDANNQIGGFAQKKKPLMILLICLAIVALMYLTIGWIMPYGLSMGIAVIVLGTGLGLSIYFSTNK